MPLPQGFDQWYVLCAAWAVLSLLLLSGLAQVASTEHLKERVRARTFRRLLGLNEYLGALIDRQWNKQPEQDLVEDLDSLLDLKRRVDSTAAIDRRLARRAQVVEVGRLLAVADLLAAITSAGFHYVGVAGADAKPWVIGLFGVVNVGVVASLGVAVLLGLSVVSGEDL